MEEVPPIRPTVSRIALARFRASVNLDTLLMVGAVLAVLYLIGIPLLVNIFSAFRGPADFLPFESGAGFTLQNFANAYTSDKALETLKDTSTFALGSVALAFVVGASLAWLVERTDIPFHNAIYVLALVPLMIPTISMSLGWILLLGESNGLLNVFIRDLFGLEGTGPFNIFTMYGMIVVQGFAGSTIAFLFLGAAFRNMDPSLEEASAASGASFGTTLRRVTFPILRPSMLSILFLSLIFALESFEVPLMFGLGARAQIFASNIYWSLSPAAGLPLYGEMAALSIGFLAIVYLLFFLYARVTRQAAKFATVTGKGFRPRRIALGAWKYVALGFVGAYSLLHLILPVGLLIWASFLNRFELPSVEALGRVSIESYRVVTNDPLFWSAFRNSLIVGFGSAFIVTSVSMVVAWIVLRSNLRGKSFLDLIASSSVAIPGVIAGLSFLLFYLTVNRWIPLWGTVWILVLAYSYRLSLAYRFNVAGLTQVSRELEEASRISGASWANTLRRIVLPLLAPTLIVVFSLTLFLALRDFTLALLLNSKDNTVLGVMVWNRFVTNEFGQAAALSVILAGIMLTLAIILRVFVLRRVRNF